MRKKGDGWCLITWYGQKLKRQEAPTLVSLKGWLLAWWKRWALRQKNVGLFFKYSLIWQNQVFVVACGILSCRVWALWCSLWDPVPWPGVGPRPPAFGAQSLSHWTLGKSQNDVGLVKNLPANAGDMRDGGSIAGLGRSPGGGNGNPLQYSWLGSPWTEEPGGLHHGVTESDTAERLTLLPLERCDHKLLDFRRAICQMSSS